MKHNPDKTAQILEKFSLSKGSHLSPSQGLCAMEMVAYISGESHGDAPRCTCPVLGAFVRSWNDGLSDRNRNDVLKPFVVSLIGTRALRSIEQRRAWMAVDWLVRVLLPAWLSAGGFQREGHQVAQLPCVGNPCEARCTVEALERICKGVRKNWPKRRALYNVGRQAVGASAGRAAHKAGLLAGSCAEELAELAYTIALDAAMHALMRYGKKHRDFKSAGKALANTTLRLEDKAKYLLQSLIEVQSPHHESTH